MILADVREKSGDLSSKPKWIQASEVLRLDADRFLRFVLFTTKAEKVNSLLLGLGPKGPPQGRTEEPAHCVPGRARKGPPDGPRAVSALPSATAGCINSGPCNRRPQSISGVDGEPRNADRLGPEACQDRSGAFGMGLTHSKGPSRGQKK